DLRINERIAIGEAIIEPGDLVVGDTDGVVVIPKAMAAATIEASITREANEAATMEILKAGETTLVKMRGWTRD
ncbi:MAG: 4-hydroxy-4-methyl-2-oxoglutarate aldolase, partial [Rhodospirillaceae bacterium]|nr:4-hydroxy-4-methyl-2-oxoglutarate aldolase [Rhodospirillaceae bacterium]